MGLLPFSKDRVTLVCFDENDTMTESLEAEATLSAGHRRHAQVTRHPVAKGEATTDNVRPDPDGLTLDLFWGNRPVDPIVFGVRTARGQFAAAEDAYEKLNFIFRKAYRIHIKMRLWTYDNMVIEDMSVAETVDDGNSVKVTVQFTEIKTVTASTISKQQVKPKRTGDGAKNTKGSKPKADPSTAQKQSGAAHVSDSSGLSQTETGHLNVLFKKPGS